LGGLAITCRNPPSSGPLKRWSSALPTRHVSVCRRRFAEFDVGGLVRNKVSAYPLEKLEALILSVAGQHLKTIELLEPPSACAGVGQAIVTWITMRPPH